MSSKSRFGLIRVLSALLVVAVTMTACANGRPEPLVCAAVGGLLGAGGGGAAGTHYHGSHDDEWIAGGAVLGGVLLGTAGYFICKALAADEEVEPAPPAPMPPPRAGEPAPRMAEKIVLRGVNFDFDKSNIRPDAAVILDEAVRILSGSSAPVSVEGHTDWIGSDAYNQGLSERRANAVQAYLIEQGISPSRLSTSGYGESRPISSNETREGRALNRRVELHVQE
jgi:outer membrane protein OmpA-like peptidoglycan-associated protein